MLDVSSVNLKFTDFEDFGLNREILKVLKKIEPQVILSSSSINVTINRCSFVLTSDLFDTYFRTHFPLLKNSCFDTEST